MAAPKNVLPIGIALALFVVVGLGTGHIQYAVLCAKYQMIHDPEQGWAKKISIVNKMAAFNGPCADYALKDSIRLINKKDHFNFTDRDSIEARQRVFIGRKWSDIAPDFSVQFENIDDCKCAEVGGACYGPPDIDYPNFGIFVVEFAIDSSGRIEAMALRGNPK